MSERNIAHIGYVVKKNEKSKHCCILNFRPQALQFCCNDYTQHCNGLVLYRS